MAVAVAGAEAERLVLGDVALAASHDLRVAAGIIGTLSRVGELPGARVAPLFHDDHPGWPVQPDVQSALIAGARARAHDILAAAGEDAIRGARRADRGGRGHGRGRRRRDGPEAPAGPARARGGRMSRGEDRRGQRSEDDRWWRVHDELRRDLDAELRRQGAPRRRRGRGNGTPTPGAGSEVGSAAMGLLRGSVWAS
ncbi:MAG: hypothetical protein U0838_05745 [Chloroflexota bacterium]